MWKVKHVGLLSGVMVVIGVLASAAGLTVDLPKALPQWLGWLDIFGRYLRSDVPAWLYYATCVSLLLVAGFLVLRTTEERRSRLAQDSALDKAAQSAAAAPPAANQVRTPEPADPFVSNAVRHLIDLWIKADEQLGEVVLLALAKSPPESDPLKLLQDLVLMVVSPRTERQRDLRDLKSRLQGEGTSEDATTAMRGLMKGIDHYCQLAEFARRLTGSLIPREVWASEQGQKAEARARRFVKALRDQEGTDLHFFSEKADLLEQWTKPPGIPPLELVPEVATLSLSSCHLSDEKLLYAARNQPHFAVIRVRNEGERNLSVIAQVEALKREERCGAWWQEGQGGGRFVPINDGMPINVGATRTLVVAVRYYYPTAPARDHEREHERWYAAVADGPDYTDMLKVVGANGVHLNERVRFRVRFRAEGVDQPILCKASTDDNGTPVFQQVEEAS